MQFPLRPNQVLNLLLTQWQCSNLGASPFPTPVPPPPHLHRPHAKSLSPSPDQTSQELHQHQAATVTTKSTPTPSAKPPLLGRDFPDPSIMQDVDGTWYAFATASGGRNVQAASASSPSGPWTYIDREILPSPGNWTLSGPGIASNTWAPDVRLLTSTTSPTKPSYVMYYSGQLPGNNSAFHCVGAATSTSGSILGPYTPQATPLACPLDLGGAIDPSGFVDEMTGRRYVVYKVDGNSRGGGGECNNGVAPYVPTPIVLQEVDREDGVTAIGEAVEILDRRQEEDGPLVEAPSLVGVLDEGQDENVTYVLFYSSHCWTTDLYRVNYATASNVTGPYVRSRDGKPLLASGDPRFNLTAPGGATAVDGGGAMVFHANCLQGRCLFETGFEVLGEGEVVISSGGGVGGGGDG